MNFHKLFPKLSAIFRLLHEQFFCPLPPNSLEITYTTLCNIYIFFPYFEITNFVIFLKIVPKILKDSIFSEEILAKLSVKY